MADDRIDALDAVRGVAVLGILLANVQVFSGWIFMPHALGDALATPIDHVAEVVERVLVEGKFYSIFSLLFGIGFALQLDRPGDPAELARHFRRRLRVLLGIGAVHAFAVWQGDILMMYALLGFFLLRFRTTSDEAILRWSLGMLALPSALYLLAWALTGFAGAGDPGGGGPPQPGQVPIFDLAMRDMQSGGFLERERGNLILVLGRWADATMTVRYPKIFGMFLLGLWLHRRGVVTALGAHRALLARWTGIGLVGGLAANALGAWALTHAGYLPPSTFGVLGTVAQGIGFPLLGIGYAAAIALATVDGRRRFRWMVPVGRMALTNYLTHSLVAFVLFSAFGAGLWWQVGPAAGIGGAVLLVALQIPLSRWWLATHRWGPAEWLWRMGTEGRRLPNRRPPPALSA